MQKYLFIDRDGTIIRDVPYSADPSKIEFLPEAIEGLDIFQNAGYQIVIVTNQSGIARGNFSLEEYKRMEDTLTGLLRYEGIYARTVFCPHHIDGLAPYNIDCNCRKPKPGLITQFAYSRDSVMIGDKDSDLEAGRAAGLCSFKTSSTETIVDIAFLFLGRNFKCPSIRLWSM